MGRMSGFATGRSVSKYERSGMKGSFAAPAAYRATIPKWLYSSSSRLAAGPSVTRLMALRPPTPGLPSQLKMSLRATPAATIWS